ncbi:heavy metal-binding domain-containing protein [Nocardia sp. NPDC051570]|uniref:heavy metal-binding domain-containing protein n=1 Tax=Nocardia sp. NPDC051570 TaxID=3364324 RepID=UPI0037B2C97F
MTGREGVWLPAAARERLARFSSSGVRTSLLPVAGAVGVESVGLTPVGEVMGCIVQQIGWIGAAGYGVGMSYYGLGAVDFGPYVEALYRGYDTALARMVAEASAMGADGVVAVRLTCGHLGQSNHEFVALGTAVRARSRHRPRQPFTTALPGQDVAKLMHAGWVPARIAIGIAVQAQYLDWRSRNQMSIMSGNMEVAGPTELITRVRHLARDTFERHARDAHADAAIVSDVQLQTWEREDNNAILLGAESKVFGTAISRFHTGPRAPGNALTVIPLRPVSQQPITRKQR